MPQLASLRIARPAALLAGVLAVTSAPLAHAQDELFPPSVTGLSTPGAATVSLDGQPLPLEPGSLLEGLPITLASGQALMVHSRSGRVSLIFIGPATFSAGIGDETIDVTLSSGRLRAVARRVGDSQPVRLVIPGPGEGDEPVLAAPFGDGTTYVSKTGDVVEIGFAAATGAAGMSVALAGEETPLGSGQRLTIQAGAAQGAALDPWRAESGFEDSERANQLAFASARLQRTVVADKLFANVIEWDRFASSAEVEATLQAAPKNAEIRTVSAVVASQVPSNSNVAGNVNRLTGSFATANQVPPLSPAAIAVGGVSAVTGLNSNAATLLRVTQARGLGFRGLSLLAVPGIDPVTGTRTIGPPGLGARP